MAFRLGGFMKGASEGFKDAQEWATAAQDWRTLRQNRKDKKWYESHAYETAGKADFEAYLSGATPDEIEAALGGATDAGVMAAGGGGGAIPADNEAQDLSVWDSGGPQRFANGGPVPPRALDDGIPPPPTTPLRPVRDRPGASTAIPTEAEPDYPSEQEREPGQTSENRGAGASGPSLLDSILGWIEGEGTGKDTSEDGEPETVGEAEGKYPYDTAAGPGPETDSPTPTDEIAAIPPPGAAGDGAAASTSAAAPKRTGGRRLQSTVKGEEKPPIKADVPHAVTPYGEKWERGEFSETEGKFMEGRVKVMRDTDWRKMVGRDLASLAERGKLTPEKVRAVTKYYKDFQQVGMHQNMMRASMALKGGDLQTAGQSVERAWNTFMPTGTFIRVQPIGEGANARLLAMSYDEKTGKRSGQQPFVVTQEVIEEMDRRLVTDPAAWQTFTNDFMKDQRAEGRRQEKHATEMEGFEAKRPYLGEEARSAAEKARAQAVTEQVKAERADEIIDAEVFAKLQTGKAERSKAEAEKYNQYINRATKAWDAMFANIERQRAEGMGEDYEDGQIVEGSYTDTLFRNATAIEEDWETLIQMNQDTQRLPARAAPNLAAKWWHAAEAGQLAEFFRVSDDEAGRQQVRQRNLAYEDGKIAGFVAGGTPVYVPRAWLQKTVDWLSSPPKE